MTTSFTVALLSTALLAKCVSADIPQTNQDIQLFNINAETVECMGVAPMRCLVINGTLFYDSIEGYTHVEGQPAKVYVERRLREQPVPADAGIYVYRVVPKPH